MSINDLLDSEWFLIIVLVGIGIGMLVAIPGMYAGISAGKQTTRNIYGDDEYGPILEDRNAKIIARRTTPHPLNQALMVNRVVFELADGNRMEFAIRDLNTYAIMVEGDRGTLRYQGKKFISFERDR
ncbi:MAG: DUF2500 domain-containing protein [Oscillospiraceae bacterium]|nr:DUF2500 domain-containing protein [Oscillospiraceae bacterium]